MSKKIFAKIKLTLFLLRLLFTSDNKIRFLIFDTLHLKQFFDADNWQVILKNNPKNKVINNSNISKETAILIPGRLRCWEKSKDLIFSMAENNKVFIMTDKSDEKIVKEIKHKNIYCTIIEDSIYKNNFKKVSNVVLSQYFKLKCVIEEVYKYEKKNLIFFKNFIKLRTDFYYYNSENLVDMRLENNEDCLFSQSDLHFSGRREFFLPLKNFYDFGEWCYQNDFHNLDYMPINPTQILNSDPGATRFAYLKYPKEIVETSVRRPSSEFIHNKIKENYTNALKYKYKPSDEFKLTGSQDFFPTEQSFAWFLNLLGIPCKTHLKFSGFIMHFPEKEKHGLKEGVIEYREDMDKIRKNKN
tara:strand:+ start:569 stop:1639 length:1071 start_codon:yes stop_codon:yes gene_type:complete